MKREDVKSVDPRLFISALGQFCFSSVGMMIGNKMAMDYLKDDIAALPSTLVGLQVVGTLLLLAYFRDRIDKDKVNMQSFKAWIPIFTLFAGMLYTSAKTFQYVHVSFVIIVRNVGAIVTTIVEYFVRHTVVNPNIIFAELVIVLGTVMYGHGSAGHFKDFWAGVIWCMANVMCQTLYGVTVKYKMDNDPSIREMSKYTMSLLNNLLCLPYFIVTALVSGEVTHYTRIFPEIPLLGWGVVLATCAIGFMISTSGFGLQKLVSATTFLIINNMTKILNILLGVIFLGDILPGFRSVVGCIVSLGGGFWYSWETMQLNDRRKKAALQEGSGDVERPNSPKAGGDVEVRTRVARDSQ